MTVQEKMKAYREKNGYSIEKMSQKSGASEVLLRMLERGNVTHPKIAERVGKVYHLSEDDIYELMPDNYRPGSAYDPEKFVEFVPNSKQVVITMSKEDRDYFGYVADNTKAIVSKGRRGVIV